MSLVPEALAYATIAGLPPVTGLYAAPAVGRPLRAVIATVRLHGLGAGMAVPVTGAPTQR